MFWMNYRFRWGNHLFGKPSKWRAFLTSGITLLDVLVADVVPLRLIDSANVRGSFCRIEARYSVKNRIRKGAWKRRLFRAVEVGQKIIYIIECLYLACLILFDAPGKAGFEFLQSCLIGICGHGLVFCACHMGFFTARDEICLLRTFVFLASS